MGSNFEDLYTGKWRLHLVFPGERYGVNGSLVYEQEDAEKYGQNLPLVEYYDMSQDKRIFPEGQFVARYYMSTQLGLDGMGTDMHDRAVENIPLILHGDVPSWRIEGKDLDVIADWMYDAQYEIEFPKGAEITFKQKKAAYIALFESSRDTSELFDLIEPEKLDAWLDERFGEEFEGGLSVEEESRLGYTGCFPSEDDINAFSAYLKHVQQEQKIGLTGMLASAKDSALSYEPKSNRGQEFAL